MPKLTEQAMFAPGVVDSPTCIAASRLPVRVASVQLLGSNGSLSFIRLGEGIRCAISGNLAFSEATLRAHSISQPRIFFVLLPLRENSASSCFFKFLPISSGNHSTVSKQIILVGPGWSTHVQQLFSMYSLGCYSLLASPGQP